MFSFSSALLKYLQAWNSLERYRGLSLCHVCSCPLNPTVSSKFNCSFLHVSLGTYSCTLHSHSYTHTLHTLTYTLYPLHTHLHTLTFSPPSPHSLRDESEVLPIAVPVLLSIPPDAHYAVRAATLRLVAVLAEWIDSHPDTLGE